MKVLVPTEGSEFSQKAIEKCCNLFDESDNTEIRVICAVEPTFTAAEPFGVSAEYVHDIDAAATKRANDVVAQAANEIRTSFPDLAVGLTTKVAKGRAEQAIVEEAEAWGADLIVMGSHGYGFWQRAMLGSVSSSVAHLAPCSVLIVRPPEKRNGNHARADG